MNNRKQGRDGFSLVEMIIAIAIIGIVMSSVILLISYSSNSMRRTSNMVTLQNQTKDAVLHITTYLQEASDAYWDESKNALIIAKKIKNPDGTTDKLEVGHYWLAPESSVDGRESIVFVQDVVGFGCQIRSHTYTVTGGSVGLEDVSGGVAATGSAVSGEATDVICFCKRTYTNMTGYLTSEGEVDFSKLALDYSTITIDNADIVDGEAASGSSVSVTTPNPGSGTLEHATDPPEDTLSDVMKTGGKSVVVSLQMQNYNADASFKCYKEVFLRNQ